MQFLQPLKNMKGDRFTAKNGEKGLFYYILNALQIRRKCLPMPAGFLLHSAHAWLGCSAPHWPEFQKDNKFV